MTSNRRTVTRMNRQTFPPQLRQHRHPRVILPDPCRRLDYASTGNSDYPSPEHTPVEPKPGSVTISRLKINPTITVQDSHVVPANTALSTVNYADSLCICSSCENGSKYLSRGVTQQLRTPAALPGNPSFFPSTHIMWFLTATFNSRSQGFSGLCGHLHSWAHKPRHRYNTYT